MEIIIQETLRRQSEAVNQPTSLNTAREAELLGPYSQVKDLFTAEDCAYVSVSYFYYPYIYLQANINWKKKWLDVGELALICISSSLVTNNSDCFLY